MVSNESIYELVNKVMNDVREVRKGERNQHFKFNFRGIDAVMNATGPALRRHGVVVFPVDMHSEYHTVRTSKGEAMNVQVRNVYRFAGPNGDFFDAVATGESIDSGDKGTAKANSVAFRTCLLQALCLPTDDPDPDEFSPQRDVDPEFILALRGALSNAKTKADARAVWADADWYGVIGELGDDIKAAAARLPDAADEKVSG